jgi:sortase A
VLCVSVHRPCEAPECRTADNQVVHRIARVLSVALITSGCVVLADAGITLLWQEPVSAAYGTFKQHQAEDELSRLESEFPSAADLAAVEGVSGNVERARILAGLFSKRVKTGEGIGRISIDRIGLNIVLIQGTDTASLQKGPGHYPTTPFPGQGGTVGIAGHRTTYLAPFRRINEIQDGDTIRLEMPYGGFTYTVEKHEVVDPGDVGIIKPVGYERLVLTACHPVHSAAQRWAVLARLTRIDSFAPGGTGAWVVP